MMRKLYPLSSAAMTLALSACGSSSSSSSPTPAEPPPPAMIATAQALHASADAPPVIISFNGVPQPSETDFREGTRVLNLTAGDVELQLDGVLPGGNATVIGPVTVSFEANAFYRVIAVNDVANIEPIILEEPETNGPASTVRLRVLHAAPIATHDHRRISTEAKVRIIHGSPAAGNVDVYVTAVGADISAESPALADVTFKANSAWTDSSRRL